jgi:hypothetical protein
LSKKKKKNGRPQFTGSLQEVKPPPPDKGKEKEKNKNKNKRVRKKIHKANAVQEIQMEDLQTSKLEEPISI